MKKILLTTLLTLGLSTAVQAQSVVTVLCDQAKIDSGDVDCTGAAEVFADGTSGNEGSVHSIADVTSSLTNNDNIRFTTVLGVDSTISESGEDIFIDGVLTSAKKSMHHLGQLDLNSPLYQNSAQTAREGSLASVDCAALFDRSDESVLPGNSLEGADYPAYGHNPFCVFVKNGTDEPSLYVSSGNALFFEDYRGPRATIEFEGLSEAETDFQQPRMFCTETMFDNNTNSNLVENVDCVGTTSTIITVSHTGARFTFQYDSIAAFELDDIESLANRDQLLVSESPLSMKYTPDFTTSLYCTDNGANNTTCSRDPNS